MATSCSTGARLWRYRFPGRVGWQRSPRHRPPGKTLHSAKSHHQSRALGSLRGMLREEHRGQLRWFRAHPFFRRQEQIRQRWRGLMRLELLLAGSDKRQLSVDLVEVRRTCAALPCCPNFGGRDIVRWEVNARSAVARATSVRELIRRAVLSSRFSVFSLRMIRIASRASDSRSRGERFFSRS